MLLIGDDGVGGVDGDGGGDAILLFVCAYESTAKLVQKCVNLTGNIYIWNYISKGAFCHSMSLKEIKEQVHFPN